ncbi:MAG: hypothetical protein ABW189_00845 [Rickettsiales bacterium]
MAKNTAVDANATEGGSRAHGKRVKKLSLAGKFFVVGLVVWVADASYFAFAFLVVAMLPSILSSLIDRSSGKHASKTVSAFNVVGVLPFLFDIGTQYDPALVAQGFFDDIHAWAYIYGFAAVGWMLVWLAPQLTILALTARAEEKSYKLEKKQAQIAEEWGEEVTLSRRPHVRKKTNDII